MSIPTSLLHQKCEPCEGGIHPLTSDEIARLLLETPDWSVLDEMSLSRECKFTDFQTAMRFINNLAELAEHEGHHPYFCLHSWNIVSLRLSTHAIKGLSKNDFILAAKINAVLDKKKEFE